MAVQEMQETRVPSLGWEDPLEGEVATHSSFVAGKILWTEEPQSVGSYKSWTWLGTYLHDIDA